MNDRTEELLACLDVLSDHVDKDQPLPELMTACWQVPDLVAQLLQEHEEINTLMDEMIQRVQKLIAAAEREQHGKSSLLATPPSGLILS